MVLFLLAHPVLIRYIATVQRFNSVLLHDSFLVDTALNSV